MKAFLRDLLSVARSKGIVLACGLGNGIIMARWLGPAQVGIYAGLMVYPHLFMSVGSLGLQQSTTYLLGRGLYDRDALTRAIFQTWVLSSTTTVLASYLLIRFVSSWGESTILALLATAPVPFILFNRYNGGLFLGSNDIPAYNRINWIPALLGFGATAVALIVLDAGLVGALVAGIVGPAAMSALLAARNAFLTRVDLRPDWELIRTMLSLGAVYAIALMVINLNYRLDIVILDRLSTEYEIGIYSKAVSPIEYLWQIPMLLGTIIFARSATTKDGVRFSRSVQQLLRLSLIAMVAAAAVLGLLADQVVTL
ncbi:MAG: oligosaccharide flippase family protein, partial [Gemmatimonadota bacterium]